MNGYLVTIENLTAGWSFYVLSGVDPDPADQVIVCDPLVHSWGFADDAVPNPLDPATVQFELAGRSTAALPASDVGDMVTITVDLLDVDDDTAIDLDARAIDFVGRLSEPIVELNPSSKWPARLKLVATDITADGNSTFPQAGPWTLNASFNAVPYPYSWLSGLVTWRGSHNIWYPIEWFTQRDALPQLGRELALGIPQSPLYEMLAKLSLGTPLLDGSVYIPRYRYDPTGTVPDPAKWRAAGIDSGHPKLNNPFGWIYQRIDDTPADSRLPYKLTGPIAGPVTLQLDADPADMAGIAVIPAGAVHVPTTARRSRDTNVNTIVVNGYCSITNGDDPSQWALQTGEPTTLTVSTNPVAPSARSIDTYGELDMAATAGTGAWKWNGTPASTRRVQMREVFDRAYRPDDGSTQAGWAYDSLRLDSAGLTVDEYAAIIPMLNSWAPEQADGVCVRPILIHDVDPDVALAPFRNIAGRLVGADLTIAGGRIVVDMRLSPGAAPLGTATDAITAADLLASPYATTSAEDFDPNVSALDMRYVRA